MMVVPTENGSIYKRIWCVYEAHLASTEHKIIYIGRRSAWLKTVLHLCCLALTFFVAIGTHMGRWLIKWLHIYPDADRYVSCGWQSYMFFIMAMGVQVCLIVARCFFRSACMVTLASNVTIMLLIFQFQLQMKLPLNIAPLQDYAILVLCLALVPIFCIREICRVSQEADDEQVNQLAGFTSVSDAEASLEDDKHRILSDIAEELDDVEFSVKVMLAAKMSTKDLRRAALRGVDVRAITSSGTQQSCLALLVTLLALFACWEFCQLRFYENDDFCPSDFLKLPFSWWLSLFAVTVQNVAALSSWLLAGRDRKPFIASSFVVLQLLQLTLYYACVLAIDMNADQNLVDCSDRVYSLPHSFVGIQVPLAVIVLAVMLCCCRGLHFVARIPFLGAWLAGLLGPSRIICPHRIDQGKAGMTPSHVGQSQETV